METGEVGCTYSTAAGSGEKLLLVVCPDFGTPDEPVVIVGNSQHDRFSRALVHVSARVANDLGHHNIRGIGVGVAGVIAIAGAQFP